MKKTLFLLSILFSTSLEKSFAQKDSSKNFIYGMFLTFPIEVPIVDNDDLNKRLSAEGLPKCDLPAAAIGFGIQIQMNRLIALFSFNKTTKKPKLDSASLEVEYRATTFGVGYDLLKQPSYSLYPYIGFKGCGVNYLYNEKTSDTIAFNNYLQTALDHKEINNSVFHLDLGLGFSFQKFYMINLRGGVLLPIEKTKWTINNGSSTLNDSPRIRYRGYVTLTLGLGNIFSEKEEQKQYEQSTL